MRYRYVAAKFGIRIACPELGRDLDGERRKTANLQDSLKESEKEYHKLKVCYHHLLHSDV